MYTVKRGDTLSMIASRQGVTLVALLARIFHQKDQKRPPCLA